MDGDSDIEDSIENIIDNIYIYLKKLNVNISKDILSIIIDDVLYDGQNFHQIRFNMHECVTFCLENDVSLLDGLNNVILRQ